MIDLWVRAQNSRLGKRLLGTGLIARSIRTISGTFSLRLMSVGLRFLVSLMLARLLGARGFGVYNFAIAWVSLLTGPSIAGFERLVIRDLATYQRDADYRRMHGLVRFAQRFTVLSAVVIALIGMIVAWITYKVTGRPALLKAQHADLADVALVTLMIALALVPIRALLLLQQAVMQGLRRVVTGQVPEQLVQPVLFLVGLGSLFVAGGAVRSAQWAMALVLITTGIALILSMILLKRTTPPPVRHAIPLVEARLWLLSAIPFALTRGLAQLNLEVDSIMLGVLSSAEGVAFY
jgi:O-antigen/teichoic acid export membrane protein